MEYVKIQQPSVRRFIKTNKVAIGTDQDKQVSDVGADIGVISAGGSPLIENKEYLSVSCVKFLQMKIEYPSIVKVPLIETTRYAYSRLFETC